MKYGPFLFEMKTAVMDFFNLQFHHLKELLFDKWRMKDEKRESIFKGVEKLKAIFYPPAYLPHTKVRRFFHWCSLIDNEDGVPQVR